MRALVVGSGAREHALIWGLKQSRTVSGLYAGPGNAGTSQIAENLSDIDPLDAKAVLAACRKHSIDLAVIGPEAPLVTGVVDLLSAAGIAVFGASRAAAQLEASKSFAKEFMARHNVPTASYQRYLEIPQTERALRHSKCRLVVKRDGLADGKGVLDSADVDALVEFAREGLKAGPIVLEEYLQGPELSVFVLLTSSGYHLQLPYCADYKKQREGDLGLNTGGMGSISPVPWLSDELDERIRAEIVTPTVKGMAEEGLSYCGVLYIGLMATADGPKVIEYNVRFGDPEAQALLPTIDTDLATLFKEISAGRTPPPPTQHSTAVVVVIASGGYPDQYSTGLPVRLPAAGTESGLIFHANTRIRNRQILTGGGRCFSAVGLGENHSMAAEQAYKLATQICFKGSWFRRDIAASYRRMAASA